MPIPPPPPPPVGASTRYTQFVFVFHTDKRVEFFTKTQSGVVEVILKFGIKVLS